MKSIFTALRVLIGAALLLVFCWLTITGVDAGLAGETPHEKMVAWGIAGGTIDIQKVNIAASMVGRRFSQRG